VDNLTEHIRRVPFYDTAERVQFNGKNDGAQLGTTHSVSFAEDPKHLGFVLARYKFVARMLQGKRYVLEVGCGDGTGARVVGSAVYNLVLTDSLEQIHCHRHDMTLDGPFRFPAIPAWDAVYALDVMEHVDERDQDGFLINICKCLHDRGVCIIGMPSLESQMFASPASKSQHINCKTENGLRKSLEPHFSNVFMFGMNDETLHTGYGPMCHYRLAVCTK
jgi:2-polyprenyl-3-methyl-5-hydroxy-6-metoxy-1,4-benzoquinol methylase